MKIQKITNTEKYKKKLKFLAESYLEKNQIKINEKNINKILFDLTFEKILEYTFSKRWDRNSKMKFFIKKNPSITDYKKIIKKLSFL